MPGSTMASNAKALGNITNKQTQQFLYGLLSISVENTSSKPNCKEKQSYHLADPGA